MTVFVILLFLGCASPLEAKSGKEDEPLEKVSVRLQWLNQAQFAGVYAAKEKGFYRDNGLDVTIEPGGGGLNPMKLVAAGSDDFGIWVADQLILARAKELKLKAIAVIFQKSQVVFMAMEDSGIKGPKDFVGRVVGVKYGDNTETNYIAMLNEVGIDRKLVKEVPVQFDMARFFNGEVDVWPSYIINEPLIAIEKGFDINIIYPSEYGVTSYSDTIFTTDRLIREKPDLVRRFLDATLKGWQWAIENKEEAVEITLKFDKNLNKDHEFAMLEASVPFIKPTKDTRIGWMDPDVWQKMQLTLVQQGALKEVVDVGEVFTMDFLESIYKP